MSDDPLAPILRALTAERFAPLPPRRDPASDDDPAVAAGRLLAAAREYWGAAGESEVA